MPEKKSRLVVVALALLALVGPACGGGVGACVSSAVQYTYGLRVYCYSGWSSGECSVNDAEQVNGATWSFYSGQSCSDRDLTEGSNPWP